MEEVTGLVATYWIVNKLSHDANVTAAVQSQSRFLGNYLANYGYLLARPVGGLFLRGATGVLPAMEYPIARVLGSVGGINASSRADFRRAMERAGYWGNLAGPITMWQVAGWTLAGALAALAPALLGIGLSTLMVEAIMTGQALSPSTIGGAAAVAIHTDCFDCDYISEPALALVFKDASNKPALYRAFAHYGASGVQPGGMPGAAGFHPPIGLTGVDDSDPTVLEAFRDWYQQRTQAVASGACERRFGGRICGRAAHGGDHSRLPLADCPAVRKVLGNLPVRQSLKVPKSLYQSPSGTSGSCAFHSASSNRSSCETLRSLARSRRWAHFSLGSRSH